MRNRIVIGLIGACAAGLMGLALLSSAEAADRRAGTVAAVDSSARTLVVDELAEAGKPRRVTVRVEPATRIVMSERLPAPESGDLWRTFRDRPIEFVDLRPGDFVVVESTGASGAAVASEVMVTFRRAQ
jgi:hypothetical protein